MTAQERANKLWDELELLYPLESGKEAEQADIDRIAAAIEAAVAEARAASVLDAMKLMADEQRLSVMSHFCSYCGGDAPCHCWNDE